MKYFVGKNTSMRTTYKVNGRTWKEVFNELCNKGVMHYESLENYVLDRLGLTQDDFIDEDGEYDDEKFESIFYSYKLDDNDYKEIMYNDDGNAYYQLYYESYEDLLNDNYSQKK